MDTLESSFGHTVVTMYGYIGSYYTGIYLFATHKCIGSYCVGNIVPIGSQYIAFTIYECVKNYLKTVHSSYSAWTYYVYNEDCIGRFVTKTHFM